MLIMNFSLQPELATKYGYPLEAHKVQTADGYVLEIHRIPHGRVADNTWGREFGKVPIVLQHGLAGSSADWVISGPGKALGNSSTAIDCVRY